MVETARAMQIFIFGFSAVFVALGLLWLAVSLLGRIFNSVKDMKDETTD